MPYAHVNGVEIYYEERGEGEPLLLLHGGLGTARLHFGEEVDFFAQFYRVIAPDLRGYGRSGQRQEFAPDYYETDAADVAQLIQAVAARPAFVAGWSDGAIVAMVLTARFPHLVRALVLESGQYRLDRENVEAIEHWGQPERLPPRWQEALRQAHGDPYWRRLVAVYVAGQRRILEERSGAIMTEPLSAVGCPTLILHGDRDDIIAVGHAHILHQGIPGSQLAVLEGCGHQLHRERPEEFRRLVLDFLRQHSRQGEEACSQA